MKRYLALLLICLCTLMIFVGCGNPDGDTPDADGEKNALLASFSAADLDGKTYDQSVLKENKITMINVWGTFCSPCIAEMPYLAELDKKYSDQGFGVIGIVIDAADGNLNKIPAKVEDAKEIISATGADYLHLLPSVSLNDAFLADVQAVPMTIFVDSEGSTVGKEYLGGKSYSAWEAIILPLLEAAQ